MTAGISILDRLDRIHAEIRVEHRRLADASDLERIGIYLQVLYDISTCASGCRGGNHMFEYLCGRAFNLAYATYDLLNIGLYDEANNQLRSLGELVNLAALYTFDNEAFEQWRQAGHEERIQRFGPARVRKLIVAANGVLIVDSSLYGKLCELATHATPQTKPNTHSAAGYSHVGGSVQESGFAAGISLLQHLLYFACTAFTAFTGKPDAVDSIPLPPSVEA